MKRIAIFVFLFVAFHVKAQKAEILEYNWVLEKVVLNNEEYLLPTDSFKTGETSFSKSEFNSKICNTYVSQIGFKDEDTILFNEGSVTLIKCNPITENHYNKFENHYFFGFFSENFNSNTVSYTYQIYENNNGYKLIMINSKGDKAIYFSEKLNIKEMKANTVTVSPNPVKRFFYVKNATAYKKLSIEIYDMQGRLVKQENLNSKKEVDVSDLLKGNYVVNIKDVDNIISQTKIIKN
ncbi:T9SS type A sorting domain-containing protein [Empedobacter falsenii]